MDGTEGTIPPAVRHEIGADAIAMMLLTGILDEKEPCIVVDYGTNAEMAHVVDGKIYGVPYTSNTYFKYYNKD